MFFETFLKLWKSSSSRLRKLESEVSKLNLRFLKNSWRSKNGLKIAKLFACFLTTWWKLWFQNWYWMIDTKFLQCEQVRYFLKFCNLRINIKIKFLVRKKFFDKNQNCKSYFGVPSNNQKCPWDLKGSKYFQRPKVVLKTGENGWSVLNI